MVLPVGIGLCKAGKLKWRVGKRLGSGACATVHELEEWVEEYGSFEPTDWAIKLAPLSKKKTRKQNSKEEVDDRLLNYENVMYQNQFQDLQGSLIPNLPSYKGPPTNGEIDGYRFLVMERMDGNLSEIVPLLLSQSNSSVNSTISFGPIATQLLACVQAIQEHKHVVVDVKPENFMLSSKEGKKAKKSDVVKQLASRIRILDLALVQPWSSIGAHRTNDGASAIAGTPLYASLNVHNGETHSRRDDLEALGYVIAELICKIVAADETKELPWSQGKSDEEIGRLKEKCTNNLKCKLYQQLGNASVAKTIYKYMEEVRGYSFKKTPDYESLSNILSRLDLPVPVSAKTATRKRSASTRTTTSSSHKNVSGSKRTTRSGSSVSEEQQTSPKVARDDRFMDVESIHSTDSEGFADAHSSHSEEEDCNESFATAMDWEGVVDENQEPGEKDKKPIALSGVTVVVTAGPNKGQTKHLIKGQSEGIVVGSNPDLGSAKESWKLTGDDEIEESHIRLDLAVSRKLTYVNVTDLKTTNGSFVGSEKIRRGKDYRIFPGGSVRIGNTTLVINHLDPQNIKSSVQEEKKKKTAARPSKPSKPSISVAKVPAAAEEIPRLKRRGVKLVVVEGPHEGESFELEHGGTEVLNVGSKPSGKTGASIALKKDRTLKPTHVRLDLGVSKKLITVTVTDKSSGGTSVNRDVINKGRAFINDRIKIGSSVLEIQPL